MKSKFTFIDLFAGCGGLSEGFLQTGNFESLAHIEWETPMVNTLRNRLVKKWGLTSDEALKHVIKFDVQKTDELFCGNWSQESIKNYKNENHSDIVQNGLDGLIQDQPVDLIIGGPPCQAYSLCGRAQDPNSMKNDYRNFLFESFVKIVEHYQPKLFVFENVPGLLSACPGNTPVRYRIYEAFKAIGYEIKEPDDLKNAVYSSADFNTPQERNRVIIFGVKKQGNVNLQDFYNALTNRKQAENRLTVKDAIGSMPKFRPLATPIKVGRANVSHELLGKIEIPLHIARYHSTRDINVFREWIANDMNHASTAERLEYYTKITGIKSNHIKYRAWNGINLLLP